MKQEFETTKLYYGFPIFILGYKDDQFGYNITTSSSSYTLGDMIVIGLFYKSNAAKQIQNFKEFTVNLSEENIMKSVEKAGFMSKRDKLDITQLSYEKGSLVDAPLLQDCPISLECCVAKIERYESYVNITAKIVKRWVNSSLLDAKGYLVSNLLNPVAFIGDGKKRVYRYYDERSRELGSYLKNG